MRIPYGVGLEVYPDEVGATSPRGVKNAPVGLEFTPMKSGLQSLALGQHGKLGHFHNPTINHTLLIANFRLQVASFRSQRAVSAPPT